MSTTSFGKARDRTVTVQIRRFFDAATSTGISGAGGARGSVAVVTHVLPDRPFFLEALQRHFNLLAVFPKPKSASQSTVNYLRSKGVRLEPLTRDDFNGGQAAELLNEMTRATSDRVVLLDIGGYFSTCLEALAVQLGDRLAGVVEDTENGHARYLSIARTGTLPCPVISVARSPLKNTEDYLVGQAVVHSAEHLIRLAGQILGGKTATVFGFGKIGRSVATTLRSRGVTVRVIDTNPIRQVEALSLGFRTTDRTSGLRESDLVVGATGSLSLAGSDWEGLKAGAFVFTVTSSDDELDLAPLSDSELFKAETLQNVPSVVCYRTDRTYFYLLNDGNAVNFLHNAVVGDFIYLVQAEICRAAQELLSNDSLPRDVIELGLEDQKSIARAWLSVMDTY